MKRIAPHIALILSLSFLAACGSQVAGLGSDAGAGASSDSGLSPSGGSKQSIARDGATSSSKVSTAGTSTSSPPTGQEYTRKNDFPITLSLNANCATRGSVMHATVVTISGAMIAFTTSYESNTHYQPDITYVPSATNTSGTFTWTWTLRPDTPLGTAKVIALAGKKGRGSATVNRYFSVARTC